MPKKKINRAKAPTKPAVSRSTVKQPSFEGPIQEVAKALATPIAPKGFKNPSPLTLDTLKRRLEELRVTPSVGQERLLETLNRINPRTGTPTEKMPEEIRASVAALKPTARRFHGIKVSLAWFPFPWLSASCASCARRCQYAPWLAPFSLRP
jgi:hypothetical protein